MSTIEKLSIQGIRSFGANPEDVQKITFSAPVTLILGENGCGKTTIIECLKYALIGEAPPASDRGKNFVHDPKIYSLNDTLGQIKLQVRNIRGEHMSVCRSMRVAWRNSKFTFETLDATVNYLNDKGSESISTRCVDVDLAMSQFMGVSKAIINNVLFCHQEDSSWPLEEGKKLKLKFDAIFDITEYNKAIEKIIKMRKDEANELKLKENDLHHLNNLKKEMENKTMSLKVSEQKRDNVVLQVSICDEEVKPIDDRLLEIRKIEYEVAKYQSLKVESQTKLKNAREQIENLSKKLKNIFPDSIEKLDEELRTFKETMSLKNNERIQMDKNLNILRVREKEKEKKFIDLDKKRCMLNQKLQNEQECNSERAEKIKILCGRLDVAIDVDLEEKPEEVPKYLYDIENALLSEQCRIAEKSTQHDCEDQQRQQEIDDLRVNLTKLEQSIEALKKQKQDYGNEQKISAEKVLEVETSAQRLKKINEDLQNTNEYYESLNEKFNQDEMRQNITNTKEKIKQLQEQFQKLDERLTFLNAISKQMSEITLKEKELEKKEQEVRRIKNKHNDNLRKVLEKPIEKDYRRTLYATFEKLNRVLKDLSEKANGLKLQEQSHEIKRKSIKDELTRYEKELEEAKEKIYQKCHSTPFEELLTKSKTAVAKYQLDHGALRSAEAMYKMYIQKIEDDPCCPLCHKNMSNNDATDVTSELTDEIQQLPEKINATDRLLKIEQKKYESLLQLQPVIEKVARLEDDIPKRKEELKQIQIKLSETAEESETMDFLISEPTTNIDLVNKMLGDMTLLDETIKDVTRLKEDITKLKEKLPQGIETDVSINDLQKEKNNVSVELENERTEVEKKQQNYEKTIDGLNKLRETINTLKDEQFKLQEGLQSLPQLKERQAELIQLIDDLTADIVESQQKIQPLKQKLKTATADKERNKEANRKIIAQMQTNYNSYKNIDHDIQRLNDNMKEYQEMNLAIEIERLKEIITNTKQEMKEMANEITKVTEKLENLKTECLNQETAERDLKDNRDLKLLQQKELEISEQYNNLAKQLGDLDFHKVSNEKNDLIKKRDESAVRRGEMLGQIGEINNQIKRLKEELDAPQYKDSLHNYRLAFYEVEVTRRIINDLNKYRIALEWSLIKFHTEKMEKINRLIREYWRLIYQGNDIDYIQILTVPKKDDTKKDDTKKDSDRRRNYNYRVIQSKNNSEIDMRGRCSAGQRVLASLIIRMALAETFSSNCGVLALDEPTTNLDRMNIGSLCEALNRIVEERQTQSNFMLIIITHDEEFISRLGKINTYHRVFRNDDCKSVIRKVEVV